MRNWLSVHRLEDGDDLSFGYHVIEADEDGFQSARGRRSHRDFYLHGFDEGHVVAIGDPCPGFDRKRAYAPRHLGYDLDFRHSIPPVRRAWRDDNGLGERLVVVAADCLR